jgi:hypothetical protein
MEIRLVLNGVCVGRSGEFDRSDTSLNPSPCVNCEFDGKAWKVGRINYISTFHLTFDPVPQNTTQSILKR